MTEQRQQPNMLNINRAYQSFAAAAVGAAYTADHLGQRLSREDLTEAIRQSCWLLDSGGPNSLLARSLTRDLIAAGAIVVDDQGRCGVGMSVRRIAEEISAAAIGMRTCGRGRASFTARTARHIVTYVWRAYSNVPPRPEDVEAALAELVSSGFLTRRNSNDEPRYALGEHVWAEYAAGERRDR
jgi:hypothetical protein